MKTGTLEGPNSNKMWTGHNAAALPHPVLTVAVAGEAADPALVAVKVMVVVAGPVLAAAAVVA